jgi:hypothetical protein
MVGRLKTKEFNNLKKWRWQAKSWEPNINGNKTKCFVLTELFKIVKSQTSRALIFDFRNKDWVVVMKRKVLEKTCNLYNKIYMP